ncbi:MAG: hypothetical protein HUJ95_00965, partial [Bacteroidales bacterium]|nr:hypothetical protein [Bacteroidales bacterium]
KVGNVTSTTATCGGNITSDGGSAIKGRGVCYSTSENPTTADSKVVASSAGTGEFSCDITGLTKGTTYYVRAYAVNEIGTHYGAQNPLITFLVDPIDYIENGKNLAKSIPVRGKWDGENETCLHWAPVNCGYEEVGEVNTDSDHRLGLLYQWGYGDPTLAYYPKAAAIYYDSTTPSPWYNNSTIKGTASDTWNNNQGPCPDGWRLPSSAEFAVLSAGKNGSCGWVTSGTYAGNTGYKGAELFGGNTPTVAGTGVFFPAAGDRSNSYGAAANRGKYGYYWSSNHSGIDKEHASVLPLSSSSSDVSVGSSPCSFGFSVRCVADPK